VAHCDSFAHSDAGCSGLRTPSPIGIPCGNSMARVVYLRCRFSNSASADLGPASLTTVQLGWFSTFL
jgi:hypothetical protein